MLLKSSKKWGTRWLTPKAKVINSKINSLGVQAIKPIKKGETVGVLGGLIVHKNEIKKYWKKEGHVGIQIHDNFFIVPPNRNELKKYGVYNHSCFPNIGFDNGSLVFSAIRNIKKGEELVFDYAMGEAEEPPFKCNCLSKNCRRVIKPTDWKNKNLQKKFGRYFSPFLKNKF